MKQVDSVFILPKIIKNPIKVERKIPSILNNPIKVISEPPLNLDWSKLSSKKTPTVGGADRLDLSISSKGAVKGSATNIAELRAIAEANPGDLVAKYRYDRAVERALEALGVFIKGKSNKSPLTLEDLKAIWEANPRDEVAKKNYFNALMRTLK